MKLCLACSAGGHLSEMSQLREIYLKHNHFFITFKRNDSIELMRKENVFFVIDPKRNPLLFLINFFQTLRIFLREKPDAIISTGAGVAIAVCLIGKIFGKRVAFIESYCRIKEPSLSGKIIYRLKGADLFLVQWKENLKFFPKAKYYGGVF
ncbi:MAG: PssD/Cps14F family polysaccharide biosynthesis glycosyltransferase [archaeon]